ncbi:MAG: metal ABC transporter permease [Rickettsiaceae bacterium]
MIEILAASILIGFIFAPLGCFVLWKRYVYYSDGLAHASMLAAALSVIAGMPVIYAGTINAIFFALIVFKLKGHSGNSAAIGLVSSAMLSIALLLAHIFPGQFNLGHLLFGDIFAANGNDLISLSVVLVITTSFILLTYNKLILTVLSKDIAQSRGLRVKMLEFLFLSILSFAVMSTIKIVGALLVTSIILIPAMIARLIAKSPWSMIGIAIFFAQFMNLCGILLSRYADLPFAPIIILSGGVIYITIASFSYIYSKLS